MSLENFSLIIGIALIAGQVGLGMGMLLVIFSKKFRTWILHVAPKNIWIWFAFFVVLGSIVGSLIYSNIYELEICRYCWYQRMALYPQALVLGVALWKRDYYTATLTSLILSVIALIIGIYHYSLNVHTILNPGSLLTPCDASGISCEAIPLLIFGYMTIPFMTIVVSLILIVALILSKKTTRK